MQIPESTRELERSWKSLMWNVFLAAAVIALTAGSGMAVIALAYFTKLLALFVPGVKTAAAALVVSYALACAVFVGVRQFSDALVEVIGTVDRLVSRLLGFLVVGGSDLFRGSRVAAWSIYSAIAVGSFATSIAFAMFLIDGTESGRRARSVLTGEAQNSTPLSELWTAGAILSVMAVFACVPLGMLFRRTWWKMALKPKIAVEGLTEPLVLANNLAGSFRLAHISDLHVEAGAKSTTTIATRKALQQASEAEIQAIALTGDITDTGERDQWNEFLGWKEVAELRHKLVLVPGNHDLNPVHEHSKAKSVLYLESPRRIETHKRALNYLRAATLVMGERCHLICPYTGSWATLADVMARAQLDIALWEQSKRLQKSSLSPIELLERLFPMAVTVDGAGITFLVWNSVWLARWPVNNSMGEIGSSQLNRADKVIEHLTTLGPIVHLMHHQVGVPNSRAHSYDRSQKPLERLYAMGMGVRNPQELLGWIAKRRQQTVVLHGHRHKYFVAKETEHDITIVSCPSASKKVERSWDASVPVGMPGHWLSLELLTSGPNIQLTGVKPVAC